MSALISVIIPAYNAEKWLKECCDSVLRQTYHNIELIVVDDGSTDETYSIAQDIALTDNRVQIIRVNNGGVCYARNRGLDIARGEYIAFLDSDDMLLSDALEKLYKLIVEHQGDISVGWKQNMTSEGVDLAGSYTKSKGVYVGTEGLKLSLEDHPATYAVWGKLYKASLLEDVRFVEGKKVHEDSFFVFQCLLKQPKLVVGDEVVLRYRLSENSASRAPFSDKFFDILYFAERKEKYVEELYPQFSDLAKNILVKAHLALLKNLCKTRDKKYRADEKNSISVIIQNKNSFIPAIHGDKMMFDIVTHHLYGFYKYIYYPIRKRLSKY